METEAGIIAVSCSSENVLTSFMCSADNNTPENCEHNTLTRDAYTHKLQKINVIVFGHFYRFSKVYIYVKMKASRSS